MPDVVTVDQIRDLIKSENIRPSDIFPMDKLVADPAVKGYAEDRVRERIGSEYQHRRSAEEELEKLKKEFAPKEAALLEQIKGLKAGAAKAQIGPLLERQREARKLDDRTMKFVQSKLQRFNPQDPDNLEKELGGFLDESIDEYKKLAKDVFGIEDAKGGNDGGTKDPGTGPANNQSAGDKSSKYLSPQTNPFIRPNPQL